MYIVMGEAPDRYCTRGDAIHAGHVCTVNPQTLAETHIWCPPFATVNPVPREQRCRYTGCPYPIPDERYHGLEQVTIAAQHGYCVSHHLLFCAPCHAADLPGEVRFLPGPEEP